MTNNKKAEILLIKFFAQYSVEEYETPSATKALLNFFDVENEEELWRKISYRTNFEPVKRLREELDSSIEGLSGLEQVQSVLALLNEKKESKEDKAISVLKKLINAKHVNCLYKSWNNVQRKHYDESLPIVVEWKDYFFSYTNRNLPETNNDFKEMIIHTFNEREYIECADKTNYVAKLIVRELYKNNLQAFFDKHDIKCGDNIKEKIFKHCKSCYVFVQLLEERIFTTPDEKPNWCYREFKEFHNWADKQDKDCNRYYFFLTHDEDMVFPARINKKYGKWKNKIKELRYVAVLDGLSNYGLRREIKRLAVQIQNTKNELLKPYLGNYSIT